MRATQILAVILTSTMLACSSISVGADFDPETDFSNYESYAWLPQEPTERVDQMVIDRIQRAVDNQLSSKNLSQVTADEASFLVKQKVLITNKLQVNDPYFSFDRYQQYEEGTLLIDFLDAKSRRLIWRGTGEARITELETPKEREDRVNEVVSAILAQYPPSK